MINLGSLASLVLLTHSSKKKKKKNIEDGNLENSTLLGSNVEASTSNERHSKSPRIDSEKHPSRSSMVKVELEEIHVKFSPLISNKKNLYMAP